MLGHFQGPEEPVAEELRFPFLVALQSLPVLGKLLHSVDRRTRHRGTTLAHQDPDTKRLEGPCTALKARSGVPPGSQSATGVRPAPHQ